MPGETTAKADSAAHLIHPMPLYNHGDEVQAVIALPGYRLAVRFFDGTSGLVEMKSLIESPDGGVFTGLRERSVFEAVKIEIGTVIWPNGADLAPDAMHDELAAHGEWHLT